MKKSFLRIAFLFFVSFCNAQTINQEITENNKSFLLGPITVDALKTESYQKWYTPNFEAYTPETHIITALKEKLPSYKILVFLGTWCGDSKREVPKFIKVLEASGFAMDNLKIVALDKRGAAYKTSPSGEEWGLNITRVPTFIIYKKGKEINRIIEKPVTTIEKDLFAIVNGDTYTPNYAQTMHFD